MRQIRIITLLLAFISIAIAAYALTQSSKLENITKLNHDNEVRIKSLESEIKSLAITNVILNDAVAGYTAHPTTIKRVNSVIDFLRSGAAENEPAFADCWDRKVRTTNWGSMGPWGVLDECIDKISKKDSAILLREIENASDSARSDCSYTAENAAEGRERCAADRDFRLLSAANQALFSALTEADWQKKTKSILTE